MVSKYSGCTPRPWQTLGEAGKGIMICFTIIELFPKRYMKVDSDAGLKCMYVNWPTGILCIFHFGFLISLLGEGSAIFQCLVPWSLKELALSWQARIRTSLIWKELETCVRRGCQHAWVAGLFLTVERGWQNGVLGSQVQNGSIKLKVCGDGSDEQ